MGEWKAQSSLRVRQALRAELEEFAGRERRKLGNVAEVILEWRFKQLKAAGSIDRLLNTRFGFLTVSQDGSEPCGRPRGWRSLWRKKWMCSARKMIASSRWNAGQ